MSETEDFIDRAVAPEELEEAKAASSVVCAASPGNPVIFVSDTFETHTGYLRRDVIGKNLSLLQGPETEADAVEQFRTLIREKHTGLIRITNYRADGEKFVHEVDFRPVRDASETVTHFIAIQRPV